MSDDDHPMEHRHCLSCSAAYPSGTDARRCCDSRRSYKCINDCLPRTLLEDDNNDE